MHIESSIVIHRPVEAVFAYVSDFRRITEWQGAVKEVHLTSEGPIGLGSQGQGVASFLGVKIENTLEVTAFEPGQRLALRSISGPFPIEFAYHFASVAEGTQLRFSLQAEPGGVFKLADPLLASQSKKEAEANLQRLKALLEAQQS